MKPTDRAQSKSPPEIEIFSSSLCPYCWKAKRLLDHHGARFTEIPIWMILGWKLPNQNFRTMVRRTGGKTTIPQIFINGEYYGDDETLKADHASGKLSKILNP